MSRILPFGLDGRVAAFIMGTTDRWDAGDALMRASSPRPRMVNAWNLVHVNGEEIGVCNEAAAKAKKEQRCVITVRAQQAQ
jgi:hypothetical protein